VVIHVLLDSSGRYGVVGRTVKNSVTFMFALSLHRSVLSVRYLTRHSNYIIRWLYLCISTVVMVNVKP
jgi:hypothetical protein